VHYATTLWRSRHAIIFRSWVDGQFRQPQRYYPAFAHPLVNVCRCRARLHFAPAADPVSRTFLTFRRPLATLFPHTFSSFTLLVFHTLIRWRRLRFATRCGRTFTFRHAVRVCWSPPYLTLVVCIAAVWRRPCLRYTLYLPCNASCYAFVSSAPNITTDFTFRTHLPTRWWTIPPLRTISSSFEPFSSVLDHLLPHTFALNWV